MPIFTLHLEVKAKVCIFDLGPAAGWEEFLFDCRLGVRMFPRLGKMIGWLWWIYVCMQHAVKRHKENMLFWLQGCRLARTTNTQRELCFENPKHLGLGRQIRLKFLGAFGVFFLPIYQHPFWYCIGSLSMFSINHSLFLQESKPLYPNPKNLFGSGSWIWAGKN